MRKIRLLCKKKRGNVWWFPKKSVPLHSQFRNQGFPLSDEQQGHASLAQLVEQLTLNQWV